MLDIAVQQADAIVICFDALRNATLESIRSVWYPKVQGLNPDVPVILACCKADLLEEKQDGREVQQIREVSTNFCGCSMHLAWGCGDGMMG